MNRDRSRSPLDNGDDDDDRDDDNRRMDRKKFDRQRVSSKRGSSDCRIYVSNIPYEYKWQDLKDVFRNEVGDVAYVEMFNEENGRPRGCAIVDFETPETAQKAIDKMHRFEANGRKLIVKDKEDAIISRDFKFLFQGDTTNRDRGRFDRSERGRSFDRPSMPDMGPAKYGNTYGLSIAFLESLGINGPLVNKIFVANLDYKVTDEDLKEVFKVAGKVTEAEVMKDLDGKSRGFGVVEFDHPVQAIQAISMLHNQVYFDRKLSVRLDRATDKQKENKSNSKLPPGLKGLGMGLGLNGEAIMDVSNIAAAVNSQQQNIGSVPGGSSMMNIPRSGMETPNQNINPVQMLGLSGMDHGNNPLAGAMGAMANNLSNALGLGMGQNMMGMNQMNPNPITPSMSNNTFNSPPMNPNSNAGGMGVQGFSNSYGGNVNATRDFTSQSSSNSSSSGYGLRSVVEISNLPLDYTWQSLRDLCRDYGEIRFAEMRGKGIGLVRFSSEAGARRAADMLDRQRFDGRVLDARVL